MRSFLQFSFLWISLILGVLQFLLQPTEMIQDWEERFHSNFYDLRLAFSGWEASTLPLVLIAIDDASLPEQAPRSPLDRKFLANLVTQVEKHEPTLVVINLLFDRAGDSDSDHALSRVFERYQNVIIKSDPLFPNLPVFENSILSQGGMQFQHDSGGTVQKICASLQSCGTSKLFHNEILTHYEKLSIGAQTAALGQQRDWEQVNFLYRIPSLSAGEVSRLSQGALKNKIVLIGVEFPQVYASYRIPYGQEEPFISETEVLAQVLSFYWENRFFSSPPPWMVSFFLILAFLFLALVLIRSGIQYFILLAGSLLILSFITSASAFAFYDWVIPFLLPAGAFLLFVLSILSLYAIDEKIRSLEREIQLRQWKIDFLTNELHSHHLFNELSRLSVMIKTDAASAREYLIEFAEMLRYSLKYGDQRWVTLDVQLEYLRSYLNQQRMIFGNQLTFNLSWEPELHFFQAPWHTFFPLVENAVKYTEVYLRDNPIPTASIDIVLTKKGEGLEFTVSNPYNGDSSNFPSLHKGIANLKERMDWCYGPQEYQLHFENSESVWTSKLGINRNKT